MLNVLCLGLAMAAADAPLTELTVYNQGFALVKEGRTVRLRAGRQTVAIEDVAQRIEPSSVAIRSVSAPGSFTVLEQNYQYDLISTQAILNKAVGGRVVLNRVLPNGQRERVEGTLMSSPTAIVGTPEGGARYQYNGMVLRTDDGRILLDPSGEVEVATIPEGLISRPTLLWDLEAATAGANQVELSYLTQGISWNADYVMTLDGLGKGDLKGWVTINNQSGATYKDATLKLLAGDVQRANEPAGFGGRGRAMELAAKADQGFQEEQFADYHLYTLQRPATVRQNEMKQISLLEADGVPVKKRLIVDALRAYPSYQPGEGEVGTGVIKPQIRIEFKNDKASNMGMPLPAGKFKVFQRDKSGSVQMLGEDRIDHTPRDESVSLVVGRAFDVVAERKRTKFEWIPGGGSPVGTRETFSIEIRNRKETPDTVHVIERHWYSWRITEKSMAYEELDSNTIQFVLDLKANEVEKITYTVETRWR